MSSGRPVGRATKFGRNENTFLNTQQNRAPGVVRAGVFWMNVARTSKTEAPDVAPPDPKAVEAIGRALEAHYADLVQAPLPKKFVELLAELDAGDRVPDAQRSRDALG